MLLRVISPFQSNVTLWSVLGGGHLRCGFVAPLRRVVLMSLVGDVRPYYAVTSKILQNQSNDTSSTAYAVDEVSLNKKCTVLVITFYYLVGRDNANQMLLCGAFWVVGTCGAAP